MTLEYFPAEKILKAGSRKEEMNGISDFLHVSSLAPVEGKRGTGIRRKKNRLTRKMGLRGRGRGIRRKKNKLTSRMGVRGREGN